jgi:hypothetical protein
MMGLGRSTGVGLCRLARPMGAGAIDAEECMTRHHHRDFRESLQNHRGPDRDPNAYHQQHAQWLT